MAKTNAAHEPEAKRAPAAKARAPKADGRAAKPAVSRTRGAPAPADPPEVKEASVSPRARKAAAAREKAPSAAKTPTRRGAAAADARRAGADLRADLRAFAAGRPQGWDHGDWLAFLDHLRERGHDTSDPDDIGLMLERERLAVVLEEVQGMGPKRVAGLVDRFQTLWSLRHADADQLASAPGMNLSLAEKVRQAVS